MANVSQTDLMAPAQRTTVILHWLTTQARVSETAIVAGIALVALAIRSAQVLSAPFPLNDGGMFASAVGDLRSNHWLPPAYLSYNRSEIPFAYPPLGFYASAAFCLLTGASVETSLRVLPLAASVATVPAFWRLTKNLVERRQALLATALFALVPRSWDWEIVGGGLTRSVGFVFALVAVTELVALRTKPSTRHVYLAGLFGGLAVLSHLEMAVFVGGSGVLLMVLDRCDKARAMAFLASGGIATVVAAPWLVSILLHNELSALLSAGQTGGIGLGALRIAATSPFDEPFFPVTAALALFGAATAPRSERVLVVWLVFLFLIDPRKAPTVATVPASMLAAGGTVRLFLPRWSIRGPAYHSSTLGERLSLYSLLTFALASSSMASVRDATPLRALDAPERAAMTWARQETPAQARFLVLSGERRWALDAASEWFPELAQRRSVATVQGSEWLGKSKYTDVSRAHRSVQNCQSAGCVGEWATKWGLPYDYIFVAAHAAPALTEPGMDCCAAVRESIDLQQFEKVYDRDGVRIYRVATP